MKTCANEMNTKWNTDANAHKMERTNRDKKKTKGLPGQITYNIEKTTTTLYLDPLLRTLLIFIYLA